MPNPGGAPAGPTVFFVPAPRPNHYTITGVTRDSTGAALGNCTVNVFETVSELYRGTAVSDASGNYSIEVNGPETGLTFFIEAYKPGSPDVAGTTVNTLTGSFS